MFRLKPSRKPPSVEEVMAYMKQSRRKGSRRGSSSTFSQRDVRSHQFLGTKIPDVATVNGDANFSHQFLGTKIPDVATLDDGANFSHQFQGTKIPDAATLNDSAKFSHQFRGTNILDFATLDHSENFPHQFLGKEVPDVALENVQTVLSEPLFVDTPGPTMDRRTGADTFRERPTESAWKMAPGTRSSVPELGSGAERSSPPPNLAAEVDASFSPVIRKGASELAWFPQAGGSEQEPCITCEKSSEVRGWDELPSSSPKKNIIEELFTDLPSKPLECTGCAKSESSVCRTVPSSEWKTVNCAAPLLVSLLFFDDERSQLYVSLDLQLPSKKREWAANGMYLSSIEDLSIIGVVCHQIGQPKLRVILSPGANVNVLPPSNATNEEFRDAVWTAISSAEAIVCCDSQGFIRSLLQWEVPLSNLQDKFLDPKILAWQLGENLEQLVGRAKEGMKRNENPECNAKGNSHLQCVHASLNLCNDVYGELMTRTSEQLRDSFRVNMRLLPILAQMETAGVQVDMDLLMSKRDYLEKRMAHLTAVGEKLVGHRVNLASPKQVAQALYEDLKLPVLGAAKSGGMAKKREAQTHSTTNEATLSQLASLHQFPSIVLEFRQLLKVKSTWIDGLLSTTCNKTDGTTRIHSEWNAANTATGRLSSSSPNLQNLPTYALEGTSAATKTSTVAIAIRDALISAPGKILVSAEYSQFELRIFAHVSADQTLVNVFNSGQQSDVFRLIGATYLGKAADAVSDQERQLVKRLCCGILYGQGKQAMAATLGVDVDKAQHLLQSFLDHFPSMRGFINQTISRARRDGFVTTMWGHRRLLPDIHERNPERRAQAERQSVNTIIQGSAADLMKLAMLDVSELIQNSNGETRIVMQVHDELVLEVPENKLFEVFKVVKQKMERVASLDVPLVVNVRAGHRFGSLRAVEE